MKFLFISIVIFFAAASIHSADAVPTTQPASQPCSRPSTQASVHDPFHDAIDPNNPLWTSALPKDTDWLLRYRSVPLKQSFSHNTDHVNRFLPNSKVPGSAGTTVLNRAQFIDFGFRSEMPVTDNWAFNIDATGLFAATGGSGANASGFNLDDHRAANDDRPAQTAGYVYSDANYGFDIAAGTTWSLSKEIYVGAVADFTTVFVDNGSDQFSHYYVKSSKEVFIPAGGLKAGYRTSKNSAIEATILIGKNGIGYSAGFVWDF